MPRDTIMWARLPIGGVHLCVHQHSYMCRAPLPFVATRGPGPGPGPLGSSYGCSEKPDAPTLEFSVSPTFPTGDASAADMINRAFKAIFGAEPSIAKAETEMAEHNGRIFIPRLYDHKPLNDYLDRIGKPPLTEP